MCLERRPVITPELNQLEKEYQELLNQLELENSLKSDHELRHELEMYFSNKLIPRSFFKYYILGNKSK